MSTAPLHVVAFLDISGQRMNTKIVFMEMKEGNIAHRIASNEIDLIMPTIECEKHLADIGLDIGDIWKYVNDPADRIDGALGREIVVDLIVKICSH